MGTFNLNNGIRRNNPDATSEKDSFLPNVNVGYGPYESLDEAIEKLNIIYENNIPLCVTIAIKDSVGYVEYWNPETADSFIKKDDDSRFIDINDIDSILKGKTVSDLGYIKSVLGEWKITYNKIIIGSLYMSSDISIHGVLQEIRSNMTIDVDSDTKALLVNGSHIDGSYSILYRNYILRQTGSYPESMIGNYTDWIEYGKENYLGKFDNVVTFQNKLDKLTKSGNYVAEIKYTSNIYYTIYISTYEVSTYYQQIVKGCIYLGNNIYKARYFTLTNDYTKTNTLVRTIGANADYNWYYYPEKYIFWLGDNYFESFSAAEDCFKDPNISGNQNINLMRYYVRSSDKMGFVIQQVNSIKTCQILLWDGNIYKRHLWFTDNSRTTIDTAYNSSWVIIGANGLTSSSSNNGINIQLADFGSGFGSSVNIPIADNNTNGLCSSKMVTTINNIIYGIEMGDTWVSIMCNHTSGLTTTKSILSASETRAGVMSKYDKKALNLTKSLDDRKRRVVLLDATKPIVENVQMDLSSPTNDMGLAIDVARNIFVVEKSDSIETGVYTIPSIEFICKKANIETVPSTFEDIYNCCIFRIPNTGDEYIRKSNKFVKLITSDEITVNDSNENVKLIYIDNVVNGVDIEEDVYTEINNVVFDKSTKKFLVSVTTMPSSGVVIKYYPIALETLKEFLYITDINVIEDNIKYYYDYRIFKLNDGSTYIWKNDNLQKIITEDDIEQLINANKTAD